MAFYEMNSVSKSIGARELTLPVNTTSTGPAGDVYYVAPYAAPMIGVTLTALSTAVVKLQATTDTTANVAAGTALWFDVGAPWAAVTTGAVTGGGITYAVSALRVNVTTALAGNQATIAIRTNAQIN